MDSPTLDLAEALIARRSITPDDAGCQQPAQDRLERLGFACSALITGGVTNLWARRGGARPVVCFAGHTDIVPADPLSGRDSDPFIPGIRDGFLYGREAADMKSSIAALVTATEAFVAQNPGHSGSIAILLTSDEEGPATDGTVEVVEFGPVNATIHKLNECVAVGDLESLSRVYREPLNRLLPGSPAP
jgi:succinyl-diaminopimelate desuccinylase